MRAQEALLEAQLGFGFQALEDLFLSLSGDLDLVLLGRIRGLKCSLAGVSGGGICLASLFLRLPESFLC